MKSFVLVFSLLVPLVYAQQAPLAPIDPAPAATVPVAAAPVATAPATTASSAAGTHSAPALRIAAGDLLDVQVFDTPELSGRLRVDSHGDVTLPVGGDLNVAGKTAKEACMAFEARLRESAILIDPHVLVFILEYATQGATILGEVKTPGVYPVLGTHGLLELLSAAGGVTSLASKQVSIHHKSDPDHPLLVRLDSSPDIVARANTQILPGDIIVVPAPVSFTSWAI